jgi:rhodanese-related sulfurtransferase
MNMTRTLILKPANLLAMLLALGAMGWLLTPTTQPTLRFNVQEVDALLAKAWVDSGAVVVDVRPRGAYEDGHIPSAISIPLQELKKAIPAELEGAKAKKIVVNCGEGSTYGPEGTHVLNQAGFTGATNLKGGIQAWKGAGFPVQKG